MTGHVHVKRRFGMLDIGMLIKLKVIIDEDVVGYVTYGSGSTFSVPSGTRRVYVMMQWCRSPEVVVHVADDETILLECSCSGLFPGKALYGHKKYIKLRLLS